MSVERILIILQAMLSDTLGKARDLSVRWSSDEEAWIWNNVLEFAGDYNYTDHTLDVIACMEADARGWTRDLSVRWTAEEKADIIRLAILPFQNRGA